MRRHTDELAAETANQFEYVHCPTCRCPRRVYRDMTMTAYFMRHQQSGRSTWCKMSGQVARKISAPLE